MLHKTPTLSKQREVGYEPYKYDLESMERASNTPHYIKPKLVRKCELIALQCGDFITLRSAVVYFLSKLTIDGKFSSSKTVL